MILQFLGTRGEIDLRSPLHRRHSALLVRCGRRRVLVDCGTDWTGSIGELWPDAILLTHAHPDHAAALRDGAPCPVYATEEAWRVLRRYPVAVKRLVHPNTVIRSAGIPFTAFPLEHSLRAPAVGYRFSAGGVRVFYAPDVARICRPVDALRRVSLYIGDGASLVRPILRRRDGHVIGHASVRQQLGWCRRYGVHVAVFTHCGSQIVGADPAAVDQRIAEMAAHTGICASIAHDGMHLRVDPDRPGVKPGGVAVLACDP